jgi:hypothetical protein
MAGTERKSGMLDSFLTEQFSFSGPFFSSNRVMRIAGGWRPGCWGIFSQEGGEGKREVRLK